MPLRMAGNQGSYRGEPSQEKQILGPIRWRIGPSEARLISLSTADLGWINYLNRAVLGQSSFDLLSLSNHEQLNIRTAEIAEHPWQ